MPGDEHGSFNLFQAILLFVERASRGGKLPVSRDEFVRNLRRSFPGVNYIQMREAIRQLANQNLLVLETLGPDDFNAKLTDAGAELLRKYAAARSPPPAAPPAPPRVPSPPPVQAPPSPRIVSASPPQPPPVRLRAPAPSPEPEARAPRPPEEKVELSTFADVAPAKSEESHALQGRKDMEDWLNTRLSSINDREDSVMAKETEVFEREEALRASEAAFIAKADEIERNIQAELEHVMEELVRQEHLTSDRIASNPSRDTGLAEVLRRIKECEMNLEELDKERAQLRKVIRELGRGHHDGSHPRGI